jgi:hypothetical protein
MEVTGPEALRIVVDSDQSMCGRFSPPPAECFAIDVALGASERPAAERDRLRVVYGVGFPGYSEHVR